MKMRLHLDNTWQCELEGEPEELARLLSALSRGRELPGREPPSPPVRPAKGAPGVATTREAVLATMAYLGERGRLVAPISEIRSTFTHLFPQRSSRLVDQILRDLVNKTGQLTRVGRGNFRLVDPPASVSEAGGNS